MGDDDEGWKQAQHKHGRTRARRDRSFRPVTYLCKAIQWNLDGLVHGEQRRLHNALLECEQLGLQIPPDGEARWREVRVVASEEVDLRHELPRLQLLVTQGEQGIRAERLPPRQGVAQLLVCLVAHPKHHRIDRPSLECQDLWPLRAVFEGEGVAHGEVVARQGEERLELHRA